MSARAALLLALLGACAACRAAHHDGLTTEEALIGFRETSPAVSEACDRAAAVAVFIGVEDTVVDGAHEGVLVHADGAREAVLLRCLEAPRAPGGYSYHALVILDGPDGVAALRAAPLPLDGLSRLELDEVAGLASLAEGRSYVISTHRPQLLFGAQTVRQQLELAPPR